MKTPDNPESLAKYQRYKTALRMYESARKVFRLARKELKSSRIEVLRAKRSGAHKNLRKKPEIGKPHA